MRAILILLVILSLALAPQILAASSSSSSSSSSKSKSLTQEEKHTAQEFIGEQQAAKLQQKRVDEILASQHKSKNNVAKKVAEEEAEEELVLTDLSTKSHDEFEAEEDKNMKSNKRNHSSIKQDPGNNIQVDEAEEEQINFAAAIPDTDKNNNAHALRQEARLNHGKRSSSSRQQDTDKNNNKHSLNDEARKGHRNFLTQESQVEEGDFLVDPLIEQVVEAMAAAPVESTGGNLTVLGGLVIMYGCAFYYLYNRYVTASSRSEYDSLNDDSGFSKASTHARRYV